MLCRRRTTVLQATVPVQHLQARFPDLIAFILDGCKCVASVLSRDNQHSLAAPHVPDCPPARFRRMLLLAVRSITLAPGVGRSTNSAR